jgi:hypothetical protein
VVIGTAELHVPVAAWWSTGKGRLLIGSHGSGAATKRLNLLGKLGEGRLESGPQVTNLPHIGRRLQRNWTEARPEGRLPHKLAKISGPSSTDQPRKPSVFSE